VKPLLVSIWLAMTVGAIAQQTPTGSSSTPDDRPVLAAVVQHDAIRDRLKRFSTMAHIPGGPPLLVSDQTLPLCQNRAPGTTQPCASDVLPTRGTFGWGVGAYSDALRRELVESFTSRNATSQPFPSLDRAGIVLVPYDSLQESLARYKDETVGYAGFSLPGYSRDGHAIVYAFYTCGGRCGQGKLFVLNRAAGPWQVSDVYDLWIS
jgi:hypothetical protein